jgi:hypothetical protein
MAGVGLLAILIELALIMPRAIRLTKKARTLTFLVNENLRLTNHELEILRQSQAETSALLRPYRRIARYLRNPLVLALLESYRRRRKARFRGGRNGAVEGDQLAR